MKKFDLLCYTIAIFISAFLLFQIQPLISKMILPWFGGTPMVWTTCMMFFQVVLLLGYAYAHFQSSLRNKTIGATVHILLLLLAILVLPISPEESWKPKGEHNPIWTIVTLLSVKVGLPYFMLASTGPLLQFWFGLHGQKQERSTYRLYALSNVGSLLALLSYPIFFEVYFELDLQDKIWSGIFILLVLLLVVLAWKSRKLVKEISFLEEELLQEIKPTSQDKMLWTLLPFFAVWLLLAVTNHVCQDVAVIPFLWIVPLALYLITFIICFDKPQLYSFNKFAVTTAILMIVTSLISLADKTRFQFNYLLEAGTYFAILFLCCFLCHGELAKRKPSLSYLTQFYLCVSAGGALGGIFVTFVCPLVFKDFFEANLALILAYALIAIQLINQLVYSEKRSLITKSIGVGLLLAGVVFVMLVQYKSSGGALVEAKRNFYGVLKVKEFGKGNEMYHRRILYHGRISHGTQLMASKHRKKPTSYYAENTGVGILLKQFYKHKKIKCGAIGLGAGTLAAYGKDGDCYRFYDINADVIALNKKYFTFCEDSKAKIETILGDARLSLERERPQDFDVLVLDAFSGDAIPVHLLTREAIALYLSHLKKKGVLALHISNRHLDLAPVVAAIAKYFKLNMVEIKTNENKEEVGSASCEWVLISRDKAIGLFEAFKPHVKKREYPLEPVVLWTDQYSNLFSVLE